MLKSNPLDFISIKTLLAIQKKRGLKDTTQDKTTVSLSILLLAPHFLLWMRRVTSYTNSDHSLGVNGSGPVDFLSSYRPLQKL